jgi:hypothetical protein
MQSESMHNLPPQAFNRAHRPTFLRNRSSQLSPPTPWSGAAMSPGIRVEPEAVDYFHEATADRRSWRAAQNMAMVVGGRCVVSLGLGGVIQSFIPGSLTAPRPPVATPGTPPHLGRHMFHPVIFWLALTGAAIGLAVHTYGVVRFYRDTSSINRNRAIMVATAATLGAFMVAGGGVQYSYAVINQDSRATWEALPVRAIGNFLVFACLPNSFSASEVVHGQLPIGHRILIRDLSLALGGAALLVYSQVSSAKPEPAPLYARELTQVAGIIGIGIGAALPRVDAMRAQADARAAHRATLHPLRLNPVLWRRQSQTPGPA